MKKKFLILSFSVFLSFSAADGIAQCAMCKAVAKSNMDSGKNKVGLGINRGVLYLLSLPYILTGIGFVIWYRNRKSEPAGISS